jgi:hypothetical protein
MRPYRLILVLNAVAIFVASTAVAQARPAQPQDPRQIYAQIKQPSPIHWCLPEAGNDPAGTIGNQCAVYSECLGALDLHDDVDRPPFTGLSDMQVNWVRRCHQVLWNVVRANPQIKGAAATQDWLEHHVYPGTEAKPSAAPGPVPSLR